MEVLIGIEHPDHKADQAFVARGFSVTHSGIDEITGRLSEKPYHFVVTDSPFSELNSIRDMTDAAIIAVRKAWARNDKVLALGNGADECLIAPLTDRHSNARINSLVRRIAIQQKIDHYRGVIVNPDWTFDMRKRTIYSRQGHEKRLRATEAKLLMLLLDRRGNVLSRQFVTDTLWYRRTPPTERYVDHLVSKLRNSFRAEGCEAPEIVTLHGKGYVLR